MLVQAQWFEAAALRPAGVREISPGRFHGRRHRQQPLRFHRRRRADGEVSARKWRHRDVTHGRRWRPPTVAHDKSVTSTFTFLYLPSFVPAKYCNRFLFTLEAFSFDTVGWVTQEGHSICKNLVHKSRRLAVQWRDHSWTNSENTGCLCSNSITSLWIICCAFVVQQVVQQIESCNAATTSGLDMSRYCGSVAITWQQVVDCHVHKKSTM